MGKDGEYHTWLSIYQVFFNLFIRTYTFTSVALIMSRDGAFYTDI